MEGLSEKTTFQKIITLGPSSIKIIKLTTVINREIRNCITN